MDFTSVFVKYLVVKFNSNYTYYLWMKQTSDELQYLPRIKLFHFSYTPLLQPMITTVSQKPRILVNN